MEPKQLMENSIKILLHDVDRASALIEGVRGDLNSAGGQPMPRTRLVNMQEQLEEVQGRLEVIRKFLAACQHRLRKDVLEPEDFEAWL